MAGLRDSGEAFLLGCLGGLPTARAQLEEPNFLHLFTGDPAGEGNIASPDPLTSFPGEVPRSQGGYMPQQAGSPTDGSLGIWTIQDFSPTSMRNRVQFVFTSMPACTVVGWGLSHYQRPGSILMLTGLLAASVSVPAGGTLVIPAGALVVTLD